MQSSRIKACPGDAKEIVVLVTLHPSLFCHLAPPWGSPWSPQNSRVQACCPGLISFSDPCSVTMNGNKTGTGVKRWSTGPLFWAPHPIIHRTSVPLSIKAQPPLSTPQTKKAPSLLGRTYIWEVPTLGCHLSFCICETDTLCALQKK